jgi:hypothetical protein
MIKRIDLYRVLYLVGALLSFGMALGFTLSDPNVPIWASLILSVSSGMISWAGAGTLIGACLYAIVR